MTVLFGLDAFLILLYPIIVEKYFKKILCLDFSSIEFLSPIKSKILFLSNI